MGVGSISVSAQEFHDAFSGTGTVSGHNGWEYANIGTSGQTMLEAGSLTYPGLAASTGNKVALKATNNEYINKMFATPVTTGELYGSFLLNVVDGASLRGNETIGNYFMHFVRSLGVTPYQARIYVRAGSAPNTFNVGILNNTLDGVPTPVSGTEMYGTNPTNYTIGQTVLIVFKHDLGNNSSSIWVNPTLGAAQEPAPTYTATAGVATTTLGGIAFRQNNTNGQGTGNLEIDEVRVGPSFDAVTPGTTTSVKDFATANIGLYPNPTSGSVKLQLPASLANGEVGLTVYSLEGKVLLKTAGSEQKLNQELATKLSAAANGVYIVRLESNGNSYQTRVVKN